MKVDLFKLQRTCTACPAQWEYFEKNSGAYVRYRGGRFRVYASDFIVDEFDLIDEKNLIYSFIRQDQPYGGWMSDYEMRHILLENDLCEPISRLLSLRIEYDGLKEFLLNYWHRKIGLPFYYRVWSKIFPSELNKFYLTKNIKGEK